MSELSDADLALLRQCPFEIVTHKTRKITRPEAARATRIKGLWARGYLGGVVVSNDAMGSRLRVSLKNKGRIALGRQPIEGEP